MLIKLGAGILRNADCGKLSRGNLRKIKCGTFRKLPLLAFPQSAAKKIRISADRKTTVRSHSTTDVQPMHTRQEHTIQNYNTPVTHNVQ